jgi:hypothetical protein
MNLLQPDESLLSKSANHDHTAYRVSKRSTGIYFTFREILLGAFYAIPTMVIELPAECNICNSHFGETNENEIAEKPVMLPCGHIFGNNCIRIWMLTSGGDTPPTCPYCRFQLAYPGCGHLIHPKRISLRSERRFSIHDIDIIKDAAHLPIICPRCDLDSKLGEARRWRDKVIGTIQRELDARKEEHDELRRELQKKREDIEHLENALSAENTVMGFYETLVRKEHLNERRRGEW